MTDDDISEILLSLMPLKDPYVFARAIIKQAKREVLLELSEWCLYEKRRLHGEREFEYKVGVDIVRDEINNRAKELE
jgi:hypothetical protein